MSSYALFMTSAFPSAEYKAVGFILLDSCIFLRFLFGRHMTVRPGREDNAMEKILKDAL